MDETSTTSQETNTAAPTDALVEEWLVQWFFNLGLDVTLQNRIRMAADDLKTRLAGKE